MKCWSGVVVPWLTGSSEERGGGELGRLVGMGVPGIEEGVGGGEVLPLPARAPRAAAKAATFEGDEVDDLLLFSALPAEVASIRRPDLDLFIERINGNVANRVTLG